MILMAIHVQHTYSTTVEITYTTDNGAFGLTEINQGNMDDILEHVSDVMIHHNFNYADVCSTETGEVLMIVTRS